MFKSSRASYVTTGVHEIFKIIIWILYLIKHKLWLAFLLWHSAGVKPGFGVDGLFIPNSPNNSKGTTRPHNPSQGNGVWGPASEHLYGMKIVDEMSRKLFWNIFPRNGWIFGITLLTQKPIPGYVTCIKEIPMWEIAAE